MGIKTRNVTEVVSYSDITDWCSPGLRNIHYYGYPYVVNNSWSRNASTLTTTSTITPGWGKRRKGLLVSSMNPFTANWTKSTPWMLTGTAYACNCDPWNYYSTQSSKKGAIGEASSAFAYYGPTTSQINAMEAAAVTTLLSRLKNQPVNVAIALAEGRKTLDMIFETATTIYKSYNHLKKGNIVGCYKGLGLTLSKHRKKRFERGYLVPKERQSLIENTWLQAQYGWRPLLSDLHGVAETLAATQVPLTRTRVAATQTLFDSDTMTRRDTVLGSTTWNCTHKRTYKYTLKYVCLFSEGSGAPTMNSMGFTNPAAVVWELIPFSFVADWFLPVGSWLNSLDATSGRNFISGCRTIHREYTDDMSASSLLPYCEAQANSNWVGVAKAKGETGSLERTVLTQFPSAQRPHFKNPLSIGHAANAVALLLQAFR